MRQLKSDPWEMKKKKKLGEPYNCPSCLERASNHNPAERGNQAGPRGLPELSSWETSERKAVRILRTEYQVEGETCTGRELQTVRGVPWVFSRIVIACAWWNYQSLEKETSRGLERVVSSTHTGSGIVPVSHPPEKPRICEVLSWVLPSILLQ